MIPASSSVVLGTSRLGLNGTREDAFALLDAFVGEGGTVIDTAAVYNDWVPGEVRRSERIIGEWLRRRPAFARPFVCTKGGHPPLAEMTRSRLDEASIVFDVEASLTCLGVERLDLFYLHRDDPSSPVETIFEVLRRLMQSGKVGAVGLSNWTAERVALARRAGIVPVASNQVLGNVLCRHMDAPSDPTIVRLDGDRHMDAPSDPTIVRLDGDMLKDAEAHDTSLLLFSSQCGGFLGKYLAADGGPAPYRNAACRKAAARIARLATEMAVDPTTLALRFLLGFSANISPVIGPRTPEQVRRSMAALRTPLGPKDFAELASISGFSDWRQ